VNIHAINVYHVTYVQSMIEQDFNGVRKMRAKDQRLWACG